MRTLIFLVLLAVLAAPLSAQIYSTNSPVVQVFAGSGTSGYLNGKGTQAMFANPSRVVADSSNNLFVADVYNYRIRRIAPDGTVSTFVGGGSGSLPGSGTGVSLSGYSFGSVAIDGQNTLWLTCFYFSSGGGLLRIGADASVNFLAYPGMSANSGVCFDSKGNLYFSTATAGKQVFRITANGTLALFAGSGTSGNTDGNGVFSSFGSPQSLVADAADNIYVWDSYNYLIRRIDQQQNVTTIAGNGSSASSDGVGLSASFSTVYDMTSDSWGNLILACGSSIRQISAATNVTTLAGSFSQSSYANGVGALARFNGASGVFLSQGMIFVADSGNNMIRTIAFNPQPQPVLGPELGVDTYAGVTINGFVGRTYRIERSADMANWNLRATVLLTASPYFWIDQSPVRGKQFYRAFLLP